MSEETPAAESGEPSGTDAKQAKGKPAAESGEPSGTDAKQAKGKPAAEKKAPAKKGKQPAKKAKAAGGKKKAKTRAGARGGLSVAAHPRASAQVRMAKGWGGLGAFTITAYLSLSHGVSPDVAGMRAIAAGATGYVVGWGCGVMVWRQLMIAELRARIEQVRGPQKPPAAPGSAGEQPAAR